MTYFLIRAICFVGWAIPFWRSHSCCFWASLPWGLFCTSEPKASLASHRSRVLHFNTTDYFKIMFSFPRKSIFLKGLLVTQEKIDIVQWTNTYITCSVVMIARIITKTKHEMRNGMVVVLSLWTFFIYIGREAVPSPNHFGTRDWYCGIQFFHGRWGSGGGGFRMIL